MAEPTIAQKKPYAVELEAGKAYYYCTCGNSANQPFCNGAHKGSEFAPKAFTPEESKTYYVCGCKHTANAPFCDGTHKGL